MAELTVPRVDFSSLGDLPDIIRQNNNRLALTDLGKQLADGTIDYRQAASKVASLGDLTHSLQFLALDQAQKKQALEKEAAASFGSGLSSLYGANPTPRVPAPNPMPIPGVAPATAPVAAGAPVPSSSRVIGDDEGVRMGLYDAPKASGARPPVQVAANGTTPTVAAQPSGQPDNLPSAKHIPFLIGALANPNLPAGQREIAKTMLAEAYKNAKEPEKIQTLRALQENPALLDIERQLRAAGKTEVNIDQKGETAFATAAGGALGKRFEKLSEEGDNAKQDLALIGQLRDLGTVIKTGAPAAIQGALANYGIKVGDNVGAVEAYGSIIDKLTPQQRIPGSGATSDYEGRMFKNSLPKLINTPEGNAIISDTLAGLAQYKLDRAAIAERALTREITQSEALKQLRDLPSPYAKFQAFARGGFREDPSNPASAAPTFTERFNAARPGNRTSTGIQWSVE